MKSSVNTFYQIFEEDDNYKMGFLSKGDIQGPEERTSRRVKLLRSAWYSIITFESSSTAPPLLYTYVFVVLLLEDIEDEDCILLEEEEATVLEAIFINIYH